MTPEEAIKIVRELRRYDDWFCVKPDHKGTYIKQTFFHHASDAELREHEDKTLDEVKFRTIWVNLSNCSSVQGSLTVPRLVYHLRRFPHPKLPVVIMSRGRPLFWDGNHRATAAVLLGRSRIKCKLMSKKLDT